MRDFSIGTRLTAGFAVVIAIAFAFGAFAYIQAANVGQTAQQLGQVKFPAIYLSEDIRSSVQKQFALFQQFVNTSDAGEAAKAEAAITAERLANESTITRIEALSANEKLQHALNTLKSDRAAYVTAASDALHPAIPESRDEAGIRSLYSDYLRDAEALVALTRGGVEDQQDSVATAANSPVLLALSTGLFLSIIFAWLVTRSVTRPLKDAVGVMHSVARGDLTCRAEITSNDELGQLLSLVNRQLDNQWNAAGLAERMAEGDLSAHMIALNERDILGRALGRMRNSMQASVAVVERFKQSVESAARLSQGDLSVEITPNSENDLLAHSLIRLRDNLRASTQLATKLASGDLRPSEELPSTKTDLGHSLLLVQSYLRACTQTVEKIEKGDLTVQVQPVCEDDSLGLALRRTVDHLQSTVSEVLSSASSVARVSNEMIAAAGLLFQRSDEQSAAAAETAAVIEDLHSRLQQSAGHSHQTERLASTTVNEGKLVGEAMNLTVKAMQDVAEKINVLDDIARRTDLLTLAAAVEAARAGEHGVGLGVVASELRKLGERGQAAAAEIVRVTSGGLKAAECAGNYLAKMVPGIHQTALLVKEIASANEEQNTGVTRANRAVQQMDRVIHQNASASQQMASTAEELFSQTRNLQTVVSFFTLDENALASKALAVRSKSAAV